MSIPILNKISKQEFDEAEPLYVILLNDDSIRYGCFELLGKRYYLGWFSSELIKVDFTILEKNRYLLIGVDLRVVVLCLDTGRLLFSMGLISYFMGFEDKNEISFIIYSELEYIIVNKNGLSISQTIARDPNF